MATVTPDYIEFEKMQLDVVNAWYRGNDQQILGALKRECPVDTGLLRSQHRSRPPRRVANGWAILYVAETYYSIFVHQGTRRRVIKMRSVIKNTGKLAAHTIARVHGGQAPNPWMYRALQRLGFSNTRWNQSGRG